MINPETLVTITVVSSLGMLSPGPDFFLLMKNSLRYPRHIAMMTVLGILCAILIHMSYCVAGLALIIATTPWLFNALKYAGATYLSWIGIKALTTKSAQHYKTQTTETIHSLSRLNAFSQGFFCNLLNPKATLFFLSAFTLYLDASSTLQDKIVVGIIIFLLAVIYWPLLVLAVQHPLIMRKLNQSQGIIDKALGLILITLSVKVAFF